MSKGITDLAGIGRLLAEGRKLWLGLLRFRSDRETRKLRDREQALKNEGLRLKNQAQDIKNKAAALQLFQRVVTASKKGGYPPEQLLELLTQLATPKQLPPETDAPPDSDPKLLGE